MYGKAIKYLVVSGGLGFVLLSVAKPSEAEIQQIRQIGGGPNQTFTDVLKAAADPSSKPIYMQKPGEKYPVKNESTSK